MIDAHEAVSVLHIFGRMEPGGAEMRLLELIGRLSPREFRVDVCALSGLAGSLDGEVRASGGDVIPLRLDLRFPRRFLNLLRHGRYRVVHSHVLYTSGPILALAARAGVAVRVAHFHATHDGKPSTLCRRVRRRATRHLIDRYATDIIACGEGSMDALWHAAWRADSRCRVIYDALDPARFELPVDREHVRAEVGVPVSALMFVHVGNEVPEKNHQRLMAIFAEIKKAAPSSWLVVAGAGTKDPNGQVARSVRELGLHDRVIALGVRDDIPRLLKTADALLLPSVCEGLPGVVLEACAVGLPALASDLPGVREIASRLSLVRYLPLSADDQEWAKTALGLPGEGERLRLKDTAARGFRSSVFHVDRAVKAHREIWRGPRREWGSRVPDV